MKKSIRMLLFAIAGILLSCSHPVETPPALFFNITLPAADANGNSISANKTSEIAENDSIILTIHIASGCRIKSISATQAGGSPVTLNGAGTSNGSTRRFFMPASNVTILAEFEVIPVFTITLPAADANGNGVLASETTDIDASSYITLTLNVVSGYQLKSIAAVQEGGAAVTLSGSGNHDRAVRTFIMPAANVTVTAVFEAVFVVIAGNGGTAGANQSFTYGKLEFNMKYAPAGKNFPTGTNDAGTDSVGTPFWVGETEVSYGLWRTVYGWSTDSTLAATVYSFANLGMRGDGVGDTSDQYPVTTVCWRDVMVWCNAATEWYNANNGTDPDLTVVYNYNGTVVRDSRLANRTQCDGVTIDSSATGFRLLGTREWELAARYKDGTAWTAGSFASGATADYNDTAATGSVAWYDDNSGSSVHPVKTRTANALGIYDMSGNTWEWCFDIRPGSTYRIDRGGAWNSMASNTQLGIIASGSPVDATNRLGFRLARRGQ